MALTYPGGYITKSPPTPTSTSAPGIWTMDQALQYIKAGTWPTPPIGDPYWQNVALLSGTGSTNGAQNNTFIDSSSNNFTITRNGNTTQGTFTPFTAPNGYWSNYFDGSGDYFTFPNKADLAFGTGDVTFECWFYANSIGSLNTIAEVRSSGYGADSFTVWIESGTLSVYAGAYSGGAPLISGGIPTANTWNHIAFVRSSGTNSLYLNGFRTATNSNSWNMTSNTGLTWGVGTNNVSTPGNYWNGYISNLRIVKGAAVYSGASFSVPTAALGVYGSGTTSLLVCQSNKFVDNASTPSTLTVYGNTAVLPFSPFGNTSMYSTTSVGGSGYFDGTGDYLETPSTAQLDFGTGDFTIEFWMYPTVTQVAYAGVMAQSTDSDPSWFVQYDANGTKLRLTTWSDNVLVSASTIPINTWTHIAMVRSGSSTNNVKLYINGVQDYQATYTADIGRTDSLIIGGGYAGGGRPKFQGYLSGLRIVNGSAVYTSGFTPPTAPPTAIANTQLLLNYTNAGIYDQAAKNDMETVGNAQVSTSVTKFGNSMYFDGTGDYLTIPPSQNFAMGTGEFTIECWVYRTSASGRGIVQITNGYLNSTETGPAIGVDGGGNWGIYTSSSSGGTSGTPASINTWDHIAMSRAGGVTKLFLNGTQIHSIADTNNYTNTYLTIGGWYNSSYLQYGYISDLRITKGLARYTYNFTPPTRAFGSFYQAAATPTADPYFDYTTLLLPGTGTNGAQNNTFLDSSTNAFSITRNGNATQGTFSPFSQTGWSVFTGSSGSNELQIANSTNLQMGSGDFTAEGWFYPQASGSIRCFYTKGVNTTGGLILGCSTSEIFVRHTGQTDLVYTGTLSGWNHIAWVRSGSTLSIYLNGTSVASATVSFNQNDTSTVYIGAPSSIASDSNKYYGYASNFRLVKGTAVYTTNFTPPTAALTAITNTQLLVLQSNRFVDNSANAFAITINGSPSVQAFSPFAPTAAYSAATNGGSGYFDGTGDYLSVAGASQLRPGTGDFTLEGWFYLTNFTGDKYLINQNFNNADGSFGNFLIYVTGTTGVMKYWSSTTGSSWNNVAGIALGTAKLNEWFHVAVSRLSGTTKTFLNGVEQASQADSGNLNNTGGIYVGTYAPGQANVNGYASGVRLLVGTGYSSISIPTAPPTAITNTSLLLNFTNAGITDATAKNDLETVGSTQISNGAAKFGSTSITFDGSGDYLAAADNELIRLASGDFTIECWVYPTANGALYDSGFVSYGTPSTLAGWYFGMTGSNTGGTLNRLVWSINYAASGGAPVYGNAGLPLNTWSHVAVTKYGTTVTMFINGNVDKTATVTATPTVSSSYKLYVGAAGYDPTSNQRALTGYLQDVRITKGIARYTQPFTPPTAAFQLL